MKFSGKCIIARVHGFVLVGLAVFLTVTAANCQNTPGRDDEAGFLSAIRMRQGANALEMLNNNTNLATMAPSMGRSPLQEAVNIGDVTLVKRLIELGADPNGPRPARNGGGNPWTPLWGAIQNHNLEICRILLDAGANPNQTGFAFQTPLLLAFQYRYDDIADLLLDYGSEPFQQNPFPSNPITPFEKDIRQGSGKFVPRMLGQDSSHKPGIKAVRKAASTDASHPPKGLITSKDFLSQHGTELLEIAVLRGELEAVTALLHAGVELKKTDTNGQPILQPFSLAAQAAVFTPAPRRQGEQPPTPAQEAARWQELLKLLIKHGADYDVFTSTALGDTNQIKHLLAQETTLAQSRDIRGQTPLHWAVMASRPSMADFWIAAGTPVNATNVSGQTALHLAATTGKPKFIKTLLAAQASTSLCDTNGKTALDAAIAASQQECIRLLLPETTASQHPERGISTPLHKAARSGNLAVLAALLETEKNLETRNELGLTPLQLAFASGHLAATTMLLDKGADITACDPDGNSLLHLIFKSQFSIVDAPSESWLNQLKESPSKAACLQSFEVKENGFPPNPVIQGVSFLLACGLKPGLTNHAGETAMGYLAEDKAFHGNFFQEGDRGQLVKLLIGAGGNIAPRDSDGNTPLHRLVNSVETENIEKASALIANGMDINATNNAGQTPLHLAARNIGGWDEMPHGTNQPFQFLVFSKANVNARDNQGQTPLHVLAASQTSFKREATQLLLDSGANPNLQDNQGRTPAHLLMTGKFPWSEAGECFKKLVKAKADLSLKDDQGRTPLHYLAALGDGRPLFFIREIDQSFQNANPDFDARDNEGNTPAIIAAQSKTVDVFQWLVKNKANLDITNQAGKSARMLSAVLSGQMQLTGVPNAETDIFEAIQRGDADAAKRLLAAAPEIVNLTNRIGSTPLRHAVMVHRTNLVELLSDHGAVWEPDLAIQMGRVDILQSLLKTNPAAVKNSRNDRNLPCLAAIKGNLAAAKCLVEAHCDLNTQDNFGVSPLGYAIINKAPEFQALYQENGARTNWFDAIYTDDLKTVSALLEQDKLMASALTPGNYSSVEIAVATGHTNILKLLLKRDAHFKNDNSVRYAVVFNQPDILEMLLKAGATIDGSTRNGFSLLHWAAMLDSAETAKVLLAHHANVNQLIDDVSTGSPMPRSIAFRSSLPGSTPLHLAAQCGQTNMVKLLLKAGANPNALNAAEMTPLDLAQPMFSGMSDLISRYRGATVILDPLRQNQLPQSLTSVRGKGLEPASSLLKAAGGTNSTAQSMPGGHFGTPRQRRLEQSHP